MSQDTQTEAGGMFSASPVALAMLVLLVVVWVWRARRQALAAQQTRDHLRRQTQYSFTDHVNTIFVALPCGPGDSGRCAETLFSLFDSADAPWRIVVGVMQHVDPNSGPGVTAAVAENAVVVYQQQCQQAGAESYAGNIRLLLRPLAEAAGPTAARAIICRQLYRRERFYAALESGARLVRGWDSAALRLLESCRRRSRRPVLTTQPLVHNDRSPTATRPTFAVVAGTDAGGFPVLGPGVPFAQAPTRCYRTAIYSPALAFAAAEDLHTAPPDPQLCYVGGGSAAYSEGLRLYTHGCDFFTPAAALCTVPPPAVRWWQQLADKPRQQARACALARARALAHRDHCTVCGATRDEHTPAHHVGHPFAALAPEVDDVFAEAGLGAARPLEGYIALTGVRLGDRPGSQARLGLLGTGKPSDDEIATKFRDRQTLTALLETMRSGSR